MRQVAARPCDASRRVTHRQGWACAGGWRSQPTAAEPAGAGGEGPRREPCAVPAYGPVSCLLRPRPILDDVSTTHASDALASLAAGADLPAAQQPVWPDAAALADAVATLATNPPLVFAGECDVLRSRMAAAARGDAFVLQGGD